jgi:hypothetical protein
MQTLVSRTSSSCTVPNWLSWNSDTPDHAFLYQEQIPLAHWCPILCGFVFFADAEWNLQNPEWIADHILFPPIPNHNSSAPVITTNVCLVMHRSAPMRRFSTLGQASSLLWAPRFDTSVTLTRHLMRCHDSCCVASSSSGPRAKRLLRCQERQVRSSDVVEPRLHRHELHHALTR